MIPTSFKMINNKRKAKESRNRGNQPFIFQHGMFLVQAQLLLQAKPITNARKLISPTHNIFINFKVLEDKSYCGIFFGASLKQIWTLICQLRLLTTLSYPDSSGLGHVHSQYRQ